MQPNKKPGDNSWLIFWVFASRFEIPALVSGRRAQLSRSAFRLARPLHGQQRICAGFQIAASGPALCPRDAVAQGSRSGDALARRRSIPTSKPTAPACLPLSAATAAGIRRFVSAHTPAFAHAIRGCQPACPLRRPGSAPRRTSLLLRLPIRTVPRSMLGRGRRRVYGSPGSAGGR